MDRKAKKRHSDEANSGEGPEDDDLISSESKLHYSQQLDKLLSNMYEFVDASEETKQEPLLEPSQVEHTIFFNFLLAEKPQSTEKRRAWKPKPKFCDKITYEDMCSVVVSGDWVLNKKGIYGKGRERRSELITGAVHSPAIQKSLNKQ